MDKEFKDLMREALKTHLADKETLEKLCSESGLKDYESRIIVEAFVEGFNGYIHTHMNNQLKLMLTNYQSEIVCNTYDELLEKYKVEGVALKLCELVFA